MLTLPDQLLDRGDDCGGTSAEDLLQLTLAGGLHDVRNGQLALDDIIAPILQQLDAAAAGNAGQNGADGCSGVDLAVDLEHDVHAADFLNVLLLHAVQPQHLCIALLLGQLTGLDGSSIVAAALGEAGQAGGGTDVLILNVDADGVDALGVVSTGGSTDDAEDIVLGSVHAQTHIICKNEGTDVQGSTIGVGHPVALHIHQSLNSLHKILFRDLGDAQTVGGILETLCVAIRAEQLNGVIRGAVSLHALKDLLRIVEHHRGRVQREGCIGDDAGIVPALALGIIHHKHVVGKFLAEAQLGLVLRLLLGRSGTSDLDIQHDIFPSFLISHSRFCAARART